MNLKYIFLLFSIVSSETLDLKNNTYGDFSFDTTVQGLHFAKSNLTKT